MFLPISKLSLADRVYQQISSRILKDQLVSGAQLPAERILAEQLGVNRGAVREGLKRLQQAALVSIRHGGATEVLNWRQHAGLELLPHLLLGDEQSINPSAVRSLLALRSALAPAIAAAAAQHHSAETLENLELSLRAIQQAKSAKDRQTHSLSYWSYIVEASDNLAFQLAFNSMRRCYEPVHELLAQIMDIEFRDTVSLQAITDCIAQGDAENAAKHTAAYINKGQHAIDQALSLLPSNQGH